MSYSNQKNRYRRAYKRVLSAVRAARRFSQGADGWTIGVYQIDLDDTSKGFEAWYGAHNQPTRMTIIEQQGPTCYQIKKMVRHICRNSA